jgi:riboflavin kinase / FMN adenylyltransferase
MQIFNDLAEIRRNDNSIVTLGTFDGIHLGHRQIIETVVKKAKETSGRSFLITFDPHPRKIVSSDNRLQLLNTMQEKLEILSSIGIENLFIINFTKEFSQQAPDEFILKYMVKGTGIKEAVIGYDHHFGKGRGGDIESLKEIGNNYNFDVTVVPGYEIDGEIVSSSKIRKALLQGDILTANKMLGRYFSFTGKVVHGDKRGRELGFPTANLEIGNQDKLLPQIGIYAVECVINNNKYYGLLNIGSRPTFHVSGDVIPEVHIFDFDRKIYDEYVKVNMVQRIRDEQKFSSAEELIRQMYRDKEVGLEILSKLTN